MTCPICSEKTIVKNSRPKIDHVVRSRKCSVCGFTFRTIETDEDMYARLKKGEKNHANNK